MSRELQFPVTGSKPQQKFWVTGQLLHDLWILEGTEPDDVKGWGKLIAKVGSSLGYAATNPHKLLGLLDQKSIVYAWQPIACIRGRAITKLDVALEGTQLVVLDAQLWTTSPLRCPRCGESGLKDIGFNSTNATSSKGGGSVHTVFIVYVRYYLPMHAMHD